MVVGLDPTGRISHLPDFHRGDSWKQACRVATTGNITIATALNAGDTIDGVVLVAGDRVLVKNQTTASQNGIYIAGATPVRAHDMDQDTTTTDVPAEEVLGAVVYVIRGTVNAGTLWRTTNTSTTTIGSTSITWQRMNAGAIPWFNVEDYGAVHDAASTSDAAIAAATDDTPAIQAAINACFAAGGGTVFFPNGIYAIKGALQSTSTYNSQLKIPFNTASNPPLAIRFLGMGPGSITQDSPITSFPVGLSGAILRSDWNGTISGNPAVIAAGTRAAVYPSGDFNWVHVTFDNIEIRCHSNPKLTAIQMTSTGMCHTRDVVVSTQVDPSTMSLPSNTNAIGIDMPTGLNSNFGDHFDKVFVDGFYIGVTLSEQTTGPALAVAHCQIGILANGSATTHHAANFGRVLLFSCKYGIRFTGAESWLNIGLLNIEHDTGTMATTYDIDDASNLARGMIFNHAVAYAGTLERIILNGATNLSFHNGHFKEWKLNSSVEIPTGTDPSTNPPTGFKLYAASATGRPTIRDASGTVTDVLAASPLTIKDEGSSLATAATSIDFVGAGVMASGTGAAKTITVAGLAPVTVTSPAVGDHLRWDGTQWVNTALHWSPVMVLDPGTGNYLVLTDTNGNPIMAEV